MKDGNWYYIVLEVDMFKLYCLLIFDIVVYDIGDMGEEFGIEIDWICFF